MTVTQLTPAQHAILTYAHQHTEGKIAWFPENIKGGARQKVIDGLFKRALITYDGIDWFVAAEGYDALGLPRTGPVTLDDPEIEAAVGAIEAAAKANVRKPRTRDHSKQAQVIAMLKRPEGATITQICERTQWERQQHDLGVKKVPDTSEAALAALRTVLCAFYQREMQCGDRCKAYIVERSPGIFLLSVHIKDLPTVRLEFEGDELKRHVGNPNIHSVVEYSSITGVSRSLAKGGAKFHQALLKAFAEHCLHVDLEAQRLRPPTLDLSILRLGFDVPQAQADGFNVLQIKSITLLSPDTQLKLDCTAMASSDHRCVTELLAEKLPTPLTEHWLITAAQINLYYPPAPGKVRPKVITVEVTRKGRLNLQKFDAGLQAQLEGYLVSLGILSPGQTLTAVESPPIAELAETALEH